MAGTYMGPVELVICDCAGCLVDGPRDFSEQYPNDDGMGVKAPVVAFESVLKEYGIELSWERIREPMGLAKNDHLQQLLNSSEADRQFRDAHDREPTEDDFAAMYATLEDRLSEVVVRDELSQPIKGTSKTVHELHRAGKIIATTTGYPGEVAEALIGKLESDHGIIFDYSTHSDAVTAGRPAPWMIHKCMHNCDCYPPQAVVKVGDTATDVRAGSNAGTWTVGLYATGNDGFAALRRAGADVLIPSICQLPNAIETIENENI